MKYLFFVLYGLAVIQALLVWFLWSYNKNAQELMRELAIPSAFVSHLQNQDPGMTVFTIRHKLLKAVTFQTNYLMVLASINLLCFSWVGWSLLFK